MPRRSSTANSNDSNGLAISGKLKCIWINRSTSRFVTGLGRKTGSKLWKSSSGVSTVSSTSTLVSGNDLLSCSQETRTFRLFINELIVVLLVLNLAFQFIHIVYWNLQSSVFHSAPYTTIRSKSFLPSLLQFVVCVSELSQAQVCFRVDFLPFSKEEKVAVTMTLIYSLWKSINIV